MLVQLTRFSLRHRKTVVVFWLLLTAFGVFRSEVPPGERFEGRVPAVAWPHARPVDSLLASSPQDRRRLLAVADRVRCVPIGSSSWGAFRRARTGRSVAACSSS